jgi:type II secretory pathway pseudopilin PulG
MTRRMLAVILTTTTLALLLAAAAPRPARAVSFVDKQVQAGGLLIQNYINTYGIKHGFTFPDKTAVTKGGGLEDKTRIWPSNPWTGKLMGPGTSRGTYTYTLRNGGTAYTLTMHFSSGRYAFTGGAPAWLATERDTASRQNLLLLQRYLDAYKSAGGDYPATGALTQESFPSPTYVWPKNAWNGAPMAASEALGDFSYTRLSSSDFILKVKLTSGWSEAFHAASPLSQLTTTPGG